MRTNDKYPDASVTLRHTEAGGIELVASLPEQLLTYLLENDEPAEIAETLWADRGVRDWLVELLASRPDVLGEMTSEARRAFLRRIGERELDDAIRRLAGDVARTEAYQLAFWRAYHASRDDADAASGMGLRLRPPDYLRPWGAKDGDPRVTPEMLEYEAARERWERHVAHILRGGASGDVTATSHATQADEYRGLAVQLYDKLMSYAGEAPDGRPCWCDEPPVEPVEPVDPHGPRCVSNRRLARAVSRAMEPTESPDGEGAPQGHVNCGHVAASRPGEGEGS